MRRLLCLTFCFAVGASLGAYQYIISTDPDLAVNPSEPAYAEAISLNAQVSGSRNLESVLETRYRASTESNVNATVLNRLKPPFTIVIR